MPSPTPVQPVFPRFASVIRFCLWLVAPAAVVAVGLGATPLCGPQAELGILICFNAMGFLVPIVVILSATIAYRKLRGDVAHAGRVAWTAAAIFAYAAASTYFLGAGNQVYGHSTTPMYLVLLELTAGLAVGAVVLLYALSWFYNRAALWLRMAIVLIIGGYLAYGGLIGFPAQRDTQLDNNPVNLYAPYQLPGVKFSALAPYDNGGYKDGYYFDIQQAGTNMTAYETPSKGTDNIKDNCVKGQYPSPDDLPCAVYGQVSGVTVYKGSGLDSLYVVMGQTVIYAYVMTGGSHDQVAQTLAAFKPVSGKDFYAHYSSN